MSKAKAEAQSPAPAVTSAVVDRATPVVRSLRSRATGRSFSRFAIAPTGSDGDGPLSMRGVRRGDASHPIGNTRTNAMLANANEGNARGFVTAPRSGRT